ncbi:hypothetical protein Pla123a_22290 [Posidoniimonas polymericola]|uniref:Uncharacterized protein n=1 Tax=Posidoniimonas polymericola TaxID=2528002 RepID=A0A5C5YRU0_9BACT|nr:hypothetical protein [Posidoniimonas polymericola]TWT77568.1 hypothetical protein Pla123a_22290 [Posidoniimonas polymericola]
MLRPYVVGEIERLLGEGVLSRREIARQVGASRAIVDRIANGSRAGVGVAPEAHSGSDSAELLPNYSRCPGCGMRVVLPCVYCRAVAYVGRCRPGLAVGSERRAA